jgi:hypothetical protein
MESRACFLRYAEGWLRFHGKFIEPITFMAAPLSSGTIGSLQGLFPDESRRVGRTKTSRGNLARIPFTPIVRISAPIQLQEFAVQLPFAAQTSILLTISPNQSTLP